MLVLVCFQLLWRTLRRIHCSQTHTLCCCVAFSHLRLRMQEKLPLHRTPFHLFRRRCTNALRIPQMHTLPPVFANPTAPSFCKICPRWLTWSANSCYGLGGMTTGTDKTINAYASSLPGWPLPNAGHYLVLYLWNSRAVVVTPRSKYRPPSTVRVWSALTTPSNFVRCIAVRLFSGSFGLPTYVSSGDCAAGLPRGIPYTISRQIFGSLPDWGSYRPSWFWFALSLLCGLPRHEIGRIHTLLWLWLVFWRGSGPGSMHYVKWLVFDLREHMTCHTQRERCHTRTDSNGSVLLHGSGDNFVACLQAWCETIFFSCWSFILGATGRYAHLCHGGCKASGPNYNPYLATQSGDDNGLNQRSQGVSGTT